MSYNSSVYNADYYKSHCGDNYEPGNGWEEIFVKQAERIVKELKPQTVLDVGCAVGYLVEGLRDRDVAAEGIDISKYAISRVREDIRPFCKVKSATEPIEKKYDLITCIEVMEHLAPEDFTVAIGNMCNAADTIIFSSTPFDYNEESHFSVNPPSFWVEKFAYNGFFHDVAYDCSYISVQSMLFRKGKKSSIDLMRSYEDKLFALWRENCMLRDNVNLANARINDLDRGNIEHAQEKSKYIDTINDLKTIVESQSEEIQDLQNVIQKKEEENRLLELKNQESAQLLQDKKDEIKEIELRYRNVLRSEYAKRDSSENKFAITSNRTQFLESELWEYKNQLYTVSNEKRELIRELSRYKQSGLASKGYALSLKLEPVKRHYGKHSSRKLMKKKADFWSPVFNAEEYCSYNPDIQEAIGTDEKELRKHFINYGMQEGRRASRNFDVYAYLAYNPDIAQVYGGDLQEAYLHYIEAGIKEMRRTL